MQLTLRTLFFIIAFAALAIGTVTIGPPISWIALVGYTLFLAAKLIDCFVATSERRTFAIGLAIASFVYISAPITIGYTEFATNNGFLPTTRALQTQIRPEISNINDIASHHRRTANALSVMPAGHLAIAIFFGYAGGLYAIFSSRRQDHTSRNDVG